MRKMYTFLLLILLSVFMLSACGKSDATDDNNGQNGVVEETFLKATDAMDGMQGMMLTGEIITTSDTMDIVENSTTQVTATLTANGQYYKMDTESDVEESHTTETYITEDGMYMLEGDGGWMLLPVIENDPTSEFIPGYQRRTFIH